MLTEILNFMQILGGTLVGLYACFLMVLAGLHLVSDAPINWFGALTLPLQAVCVIASYIIRIVAFVVIVISGINIALLRHVIEKFDVSTGDWLTSAARWVYTSGAVSGESSSVEAMLENNPQLRQMIQSRVNELEKQHKKRLKQVEDRSKEQEFDLNRIVDIIEFAQQNGKSAKWIREHANKTLLTQNT